MRTEVEEVGARLVPLNHIILLDSFHRIKLTGSLNTGEEDVSDRPLAQDTHFLEVSQAALVPSAREEVE